MTEIVAHHGIFRDTHLHVEDSGDTGRPVVLLHGWPLSSATWRHQVPALVAAEYRAVTYDRRGFGQSDKPTTGYTYDTLAEDLHTLILDLELFDVTLVGFSMGGGEVARYCANFGTERLHSVVFASAVTPYMLETRSNPEGPLTKTKAVEMAAALAADDRGFYDEFTREFFSVNGKIAVSEAERQRARKLCSVADKRAALGCLAAFGATDFRDDLAAVDVPALVLHGDSDATVPFEGSGRRTHAAIAGSTLHLIADAPHGCNVSHAEEFNRVLIGFLDA